MLLLRYYCEYLEDGLTRKGQSLFANNPQGWAAWITDFKTYKYGRDDLIRRNEFLFFEMMHEKLSQDEVCELLHISEEEYMQLQQELQSNLAMLQDFFKLKGINGLALYGMGSYGQRFLNYLRWLNMPVAYVIDKNCDKVNFKPAYSLEDVLPDVGSICITLKNVPDRLVEELQGKMPEAHIWKLMDMGLKHW